MPISPRKGWLARFASAVRLPLVAVLLTGPGASSAALFRDAADTAAPVVARLSGSLAARMITAAGLGALSVLATRGTALANAPYDDEFNVSTLDPKWSWVRESPANWSLSAVPGSMQMNTQGDIYGTSNTAPVLLQTAPTGDYQVTTHVTANPSFSAKYEQAGLVLYGDDDNYVRLTFGYDGLGSYGTGFELGQEVAAKFQSVIVSAPTSSNSFYLRVVRTGANYTGYYSTDGNTWVQVGQQNNVHITVGKMGLLSMQGGATAIIPADFDFFHADLLPCQRPDPNDEFNSSALDPKWFWVRQHVGEWSLSADPGYLQITTENDDIWGNTNNAPVLLQASPGGDFDVSTKVTMSPAPTMNYRQGGLVIYGDDDNYVRLNFGYFGSYGTGFEFGQEVAANFQSVIVSAPPNASTFYLRVVKSGQSYTGYFSQDGTTWTQVGQHNNLTFAVTEVGLTAFNGYNVIPTPSSIAANFDFFHVQAPTCQTPPAASDAYQPLTNAAESADPVQTFTGNFGYSHTDLAIAGRGPSPAFMRSYNSTDTRVGPLGPGWTHNYSIRLTDPGDGTSDLILVGPQGRSDRYTHNSDGSYTPPPAVYTTLAKNSDGTYTATQPDQSSWTFNAAGQLTRIADRFGNAPTLTYNAAGQLVAIADPAGRGALTLAYNPNGTLASVSDWLSPARTVQYGYDSSGRLSTVTDRNGKVTTYGYDGATSHLATITDANNHVAVTMTYDGQGRVATQKDALGRTTGQQTTFSYVANGDGTQTTTVTYPQASFDATNPTVTDTYDTQGRLIKEVRHPSATESYTETYGYDANSNLSTVVDARGNTTTSCYDVDYTGATISTSHGNLTRTIAPAPTNGGNPLVTLYKYDSKNNLLETIPPRGVGNGAAATCATDLSSVINTTYATDETYDANGIDLLSITTKYTDPDLGPQTAITKFEYNDASNPGVVTRIIPPRGNTGASPDYSYATSFVYNTSGSQAGMLQATTDPLGNETTYTYDPVGRRLTMVDPNGNVSGGNPSAHTWTYSYDNEDRPTQVQAPAPTTGGAALTTQYQYDPVGNRTVVIDANGQVTKYLYDVRDSLAEVDQSPLAWTNPASPPATVYKTTYSYDNLGNLSRVTRDQGDSPNERATDYAYDGLNRLRTETQYPAWPTTTPTLVTSYTYDGNGNRLTLKDPLGQTTTFGYDPLNRLTSVSYSDGVTPNVTYSYDANGNRTAMVDGTGTTSYSYDERDRLLSVTSPGSRTVGYRYDLDGNRTKLIYPDSTAVVYTFNKASQLQSLLDWANRQVSYAYTPDGSLQGATNFNGTSASYAYDNALRLTQVLNQAGSSVVDQHTYTLDNVGNRTARSETLAQLSGGPLTTNLTYGYDQLDRLTSVNNGATTYSYDPVGNRLTKNATGYTYDRADRILSAGSTSYTVNADGNLTARGTDIFAYDQANRLTSATVNGTTSTDTYDGDGKRASQTVGSTTTNYVYDVNASLPNVLTDGPFKYVYGLGLAYAVDSSGNVQVYHTDGLGSVRAITDANGNLIQTYQTDEFGVPTSSQGTSSQPFQYTGQQVDPSGLVHLRARMYDPSTGRFLSRDPLLGSLAAPLSLNAFSYVLNNPVALIDPSGFSPSRVTRNGSTDNECFSSANGQLGGNVVFATCLDTSVGVVVYAVVRTPSGPAVVPIVVFAKPPKDSTGSGKDRLRGRSARQREKSLIRLLQRGMTLKQAADFQRLIEAVKKAEGRGGADNLGPDILRALRNQIVGGGNQ